MNIFLVLITVGIIGLVIKKIYNNLHSVKSIPLKPKDWKSYYEDKIPPPNLENSLIPPWEKFEYDRYDMGWRMGVGEDYLSLWWIWFEKLSEEDKIKYQTKFPEPIEKNWKGFYKDEFDDENEV